MGIKIICGNMKRFICTVFFLKSFISLSAQEVSNYLKEQKITGKVKSVTEVHSNGQKYVYVFDEKGLETEKWFFNPVEVLLFRMTRKFDSKGHLLEEIHFDKGISIILKVEYGYSPNGIPMGRTIYGSNQKPLEKFIYRYNTGNKIIDSSHYDFYGTLIEKFLWNYDTVRHVGLKKWIRPRVKDTSITRYEYDMAWRLTREKNIASNDSSEVSYDYDSKGRLLKESRRYQDGGNDLIKKYAYDNKGNITLSAEHKADGSFVRKFTCEYDSLDRKTSENWYNSLDSVFNKYIRLYDQRNNEIELKGINASGETEVKIARKFEYDEYGNWIKMTQFVNEQAGEIITRHIEYY